MSWAVGGWMLFCPPIRSMYGKARWSTCNAANPPRPPMQCWSGQYLFHSGGSPSLRDFQHCTGGSGGCTLQNLIDNSNGADQKSGQYLFHPQYWLGWLMVDERQNTWLQSRGPCGPSVDRPVDRSVDRCIFIGFLPWTVNFKKKIKYFLIF